MAAEDLVEHASELGKRRQAQRRAQRESCRAQALTDYIEEGPRRSKAELFRKYQEKGRRDGRQSVPTMRNETFYTWAKEDHWDERALEHDAKARQAAMGAMTEVEVHAVLELKQLTGLAIATLKAVLTGEDAQATPSHRLRAAELVLSRVKPEAEEAEAPAPIQLPADADGNVVDFMETYKRLIAER